MSKFIFDELVNDEKFIQEANFDGVSFGKVISKLAKYNYFVKNLSDDDNYNEIVSYIKSHVSFFSDIDWSSDIDKAIKRVKKYPYKKIESIKITQNELDYIKSYNDIKQEKLLFVMLCFAKYNHDFHGTSSYWVNESHSLIFKEARVHVKAVERPALLRELLLKGAFTMSNAPGTFSKKLAYVSEDSNDPVILELTEIDFEELAYTYLFYKDGFTGFVHCANCGRLTRKKVNNQKYCKECAKEKEREHCASRVMKYRLKCNDSDTSS